MSRAKLLEDVETLQNMLVAYATDGTADNTAYRELRARLQDIPKLPRFVRTCRSLSQFWAFIKGKFSTYAERRAYLWDEFRPLLETLETAGPADDSVSEVLERFDAEAVHTVWAKALQRREGDPDGAITSARTLLESVCKHILDGRGVGYDDKDDLPKLYRLTAKELNLAPDQHAEGLFRQILGGCSAVVEGLGAVRNRLSDSHGRGKRGPRPSPRHARLAVNLAGAMATFLVETYSKE